MAGRVLKLFFTNDDMKSLSTFEFSNYTVQGTMFSRASLNEFKNRKESYKPGVYLIYNETAADDSLLYIGEGDPVLPRLLDHNINKDFWTYAIVFTSKDENLTKTQIQYLEAKLIQTAIKCKRIKLDNIQISTVPTLSESGLCEVDLFLDIIFKMLQALRINFFEPLNTEVSLNETDIIYEMSVKGTVAKMVIKNGKYVLLKDSLLASKNSSKAKSYIRKLRQDLKDNGLVAVHTNDLWIAVDNIEFSSASYAANAVAGYNLNGLTTWKHQGKTLKDILSEGLNSK